MGERKEYQKLTSKVRRRWIRALRSGKYKRADGELRVVDDRGKILGHCCLGVLCDLLDPKGWDSGEAAHRDRHGFPDHDLRKIAQLDDRAMYDLADMNDSLGPRAGFASIATWIEKNL